MATEPIRGCGYRKIGGLYLVGGQLMLPCDRMPFELKVCPVCSCGIKPARSWTWIEPVRLFGDHEKCNCRDFERANTLISTHCPMCHPTEVFRADSWHQGNPENRLGEFEPPKKAGLLWIGHGYYPTPDHFNREANKLGISRRISHIPKGFKVGATWVFFAHQKCNLNLGGVFDQYVRPGIFSAFFPRRIEMLVKQSDHDCWELVNKYISSEKLDYELDRKKIMKDSPFSERTRNAWDKMRKGFERGITFVAVPDDDKDHQ
jgi:hypothetical protein